MYAFQIFLITALLQISPICAKPFVTANLEGQLGNQMFQIAAAVSLAMDHNADAVFPDLVEKSNYGIPTNYKHVFFRLNATRPNEPVAFEYVDPNCPYKPIPFHPNMRIRWWLQSEKYFCHNKKVILDLFEPSDTIKNYLRNRYEEYYTHPNSVSVHFRNYLKEDPGQRFHNTCGIAYYEKAISLFPEDSLFIVCSNDIGWCKQAFAHIPRTFIFIENEQYYHDLYLMSMCKHNIISNSSFSWWGAYLNKNLHKIVFAPSKWFADTSGQDYKDVVPNSWNILPL
jgi:hypothetical protein